MPLRTFILALLPVADEKVLEAVYKIKYRDFITVALVIDEAELFPDNWLYIHDESVQVGRIQNYKNWSPEMVPDRSKTCLGMEYFCAEGDALWGLSDRDLIALATRELFSLGLVAPHKIIDGTVVRVPKAYPVYDEGFEQSLGVVRRYLEGFKNLQEIGRNGLHKYNNMDHSMLTGILAVQNLYGKHHDLWTVNADEEYLEEESITTG
jgi:protoporphyrinogen oxidase